MAPFEWSNALMLSACASMSVDDCNVELSRLRVQCTRLKKDKNPAADALEKNKRDQEKIKQMKRESKPPPKTLTKATRKTSK